MKTITHNNQEYIVIDDYPEVTTAYREKKESSHIEILTIFRYDEFHSSAQIALVHIPTFQKVVDDIKYQHELEMKLKQEELNYERNYTASAIAG